LNEEFRRRTKTQGSFGNESSALVLLWGLIAFGHVRLNRVSGWKEMQKLKEVA
jgi:transposase-like protein